MTTALRSVPDVGLERQPYARVGDPHAMLLAGPVASAGAETLTAHVRRLGRLELTDPEALVADIERSGLTGRGGAAFPTVRKVLAVRAAMRAGRGAPVVIINASESEPLSRKDVTLLTLRPHLVLDGAAVAAHVVGAREVVVHLHRGSGAVAAAVQRAIDERAAAALPDPRWRVSQGPARYVAGESTAVVSYLSGGDAKPLFTRRPLAEDGMDHRPTLLNNAETVAHLGLIARLGGLDWRSAGSSPWSGPLLLTVHGAVAEPGAVVEATGHFTLGELLTDVGGLAGPPPAVLIGGYAGRWLAGPRAWRLHADAAAMAAAGAPIGCGLIAVLPAGACGLRETARLLTWLAAESARQCGPCVFGLPAMASLFTSVANGHASRRTVSRFERLVQTIEGRGACRHPDGAIGLARSAIETFVDDVSRHVRRRACRPTGQGSVLPVPRTEVGWR